jgi:homoserine O-acetyltransferase/O-succinyltransferase
MASRSDAVNSAHHSLRAVGEAAFLREGILELPAPFPLHHGGQLDAPRLAWRLAGDPRLPMVLAIGGISAHRKVFDERQPRAGWWHEVAGPGRALDSTRCCILGIDYLGGSGESKDLTGRADLPSISSYDQAVALHCLLDHLGVARLRAILGASYGGMVALAFGERYPERVARLLVISASDRAHPMATAWRCVQRRTVRFAMQQGRACEGLELARALAMTTYRSAEEFSARFDAPPVRIDAQFVFPVEEYLFARGRDFAARVQAEEFLCLSESIDLHRVDATRITVPTTVIAVRDDLLVPLEDMRALATRLPDARLHEISSPHGHDAFLKEGGQLRPTFACIYGEC